MKRISIALGAVLLSASMASAIVIDDYDGTVTHSGFRATWTEPDLLTTGQDRGGQLQGFDMGIDVSGLGGTEAVLTLTVRENALSNTNNPANTLASLGKVMIGDAADRRWMFILPALPGPVDQWVTLTSTSSFRDFGQGTDDGQAFDWASLDDYWVQYFDDFVTGDQINITFDEMTIEAIPEPATLGLLGLFGGGLMFMRRRFKK